MSEASESGQEKTEEPTDQRLEKAREEGQGVRSQDLTTFVLFLTLLVIFSIIGPELGFRIQQSLQQVFVVGPYSPMDHAVVWVSLFLKPVLIQLIIIMVSLFGVALLCALMQSGFNVSLKKLEPKTESLNPLQGIKRLVSFQQYFQFFKSVLKMIVIAFIVYLEMNSHWQEVMNLSVLSLSQALRWSIEILSNITIRILIFLGAISLLDYLYQWFRFRNQVKMTRQELKDEHKENEVSDQIKSKVRQTANERAKKAIRKEVPMADVVITNPTHFAIAIRYNRFVDSAPRVVAKGKDLMAATIRALAKENNVPLYEFPPLARQLYKKVKVGQMVPPELYEGVAKVLGFIYRVYKKNIIKI